MRVGTHLSAECVPNAQCIFHVGNYLYSVRFVIKSLGYRPLFIVPTSEQLQLNQFTH